jgi:Rod binding domain-containing protein
MDISRATRASGGVLDLSAARRLGASLPTDGSVIEAAKFEEPNSRSPQAPTVGEFGQMLNRQRDYAATTSRQGIGESDKSIEDKAREAAEDFVSQAFVQPMLKQLRESNDAWGPFAPGTGEKQMRSLADAQLARNLVKASNWPLVEQIRRNVMKQGPEALAGSPADIKQRAENKNMPTSAISSREIRP